MPLIILMYLGAAALTAGGPIAGYFMHDAAKRKEAAYLAAEDAANLEALLTAEVGRAELRQRAQALGVDPDQVKLGYEALRDGRVTMSDVIRQLGQAA